MSANMVFVFKSILVESAASQKLLPEKIALSIQYSLQETSSVGKMYFFIAAKMRLTFSEKQFTQP